MPRAQEPGLTLAKLGQKTKMALTWRIVSWLTMHAPSLLLCLTAVGLTTLEGGERLAILGACCIGCVTELQLVCVCVGTC